MRLIPFAIILLLSTSPLAFYYNVIPSDTTNPIVAGTLQYPISINFFDCTFNATVVKENSEAHSYKTKLSDGACANQTHYLILDGNAYLLQDEPSDDQDVYIDIGSGADIIWFKSTLTRCHTLDGDPLDATSDNTPMLIGNSVFFNVLRTSGFKVLYNNNNEIGYKVDSTNTDVVCDNAISIPDFGPTDLIFEDDFEGGE